MKFFLIYGLITLTLFLNTPQLIAQMVDQKGFKDTLEYMESVEKQIFSQFQSPSGFLEFNQIDWTLSPAVFQLRESPGPFLIDGNSLNGLGLGISALKPLSDSIRLFTGYSGIFFQGELIGKAGVLLPDSSWNSRWNFHRLQSSIQFLLLHEKKLLLPLSLGLQGEFYDYSLNSESVDAGVEDWDIFFEQSGFLWGAWGQASVVLNLESLSLSPYYVFSVDFNGVKGSLRGVLHGTEQEVFPRESWEDSPYLGGSLGVDLSYRVDPVWSFGASLMNLIPLLKTSYDSGELLTMVCYLRYRR